VACKRPRGGLDVDVDNVGNVVDVDFVIIYVCFFDVSDTKIGRLAHER
jgi:hypothetical protein